MSKFVDAIKNGSGPVTYKIFYATLGALIMATIVVIGGLGSYVMAQHTSVPHPATSAVIDDTKGEVTQAVKDSEARLHEQLAEQRIEQRIIDTKIDRILNFMIEDARARGNTQ